MTGSSAGTTGAPGMSAYSASKAAVRNLARTWAEDLKGTGIRLNVLSPGATATELAKEALGEEGQKVHASMDPLQRMADPAEIGAVAAFLASQDSSFMTGSEVAVDGGLAQSDALYELRDYRLRQDRQGSCEGGCPRRHRSIRCNQSRPGKLCIPCSRDRTRISAGNRTKRSSRFRNPITAAVHARRTSGRSYA